MQTLKPVLTLAGLDPCGGAGLAADLKTFESFRVQGLCACTAITIQNEDTIRRVEWVSASLILDQIIHLEERYIFEVVKIGILNGLDTLNRILDHIGNKNRFIIWDPIIRSSGGYTFLQNMDASGLQKAVRRIGLITPNIPEAVELSQIAGFTSTNEWIRSLTRQGCQVLLKGGHSGLSTINDTLFTGQQKIDITGEYYPGFTKHGTGCVLSAAIAALIATGDDLENACKNAKAYIHQFLLSTPFKYGLHHPYEKK